MGSLKAAFSALSGPPRPSTRPRTLVTPLKEGFVKGSPGSGRGVLVGSLSQPDTVATVAAALAIASELRGAQVVYSPSPLGGLVAIVHPSRAGLDDVDRLISAESARLFKNGRTSSRLWSGAMDANVREKARTYGQMQLLEGFFRMEDQTRRTGELQQAAFTAALQKFNSRVAVRVGGVR
jgi:hypothetical protein